MKGVLIPVDGVPKPIHIQKDADGSALDALQRLVGGNIEAFDALFGEAICVYVNEEGLFSCPPNRAVYATQAMEEAGYISQLDYSHVVRAGELYTILFGNLVAVGYDPETGEDRDLTDGEIKAVCDYFNMVSAPGSGVREVLAIRSGKSEDHVSIQGEAKAMRDAADQLDGHEGQMMPDPER